MTKYLTQDSYYGTVFESPLQVGQLLSLRRPRETTYFTEIVFSPLLQYASGLQTDKVF